MSEIARRGRGPAVDQEFDEKWSRLPSIDRNGLKNRAKLLADQSFAANSTGQMPYSWQGIYMHRLIMLVNVRIAALCATLG
jgi:hypothetical protein